MKLGTGNYKKGGNGVDRKIRVWGSQLEARIFLA